MKQALSMMIFVSGVMAMGSACAAPTTVDLSGVGASPGSIGDATFGQMLVQPAGSGVLHSFVRIQANTGIEQAYNTRVNGVYDNNGSNTFNHEVTVGQIGIIDSNGASSGGEVMRFLLDINQNDKQKGKADNPDGSKLNLDEVQIYLSRTKNLFDTPVLNQNDRLFAPPKGYLVYQMDYNKTTETYEDSKVILDGDLKPGSGSTDMYMDISLAALNDAFDAGGFVSDAEKNGAYLYLYSRFGSAPNENNAGFEEWAAVKGNVIGEPPCDPEQQVCTPQEVPEPGSLSLIALGLLGAACTVARKRRG